MLRRRSQPQRTQQSLRPKRRVTRCRRILFELLSRLNEGLTPPLSASLEYDLTVDDHVADHAVANFGECFDTVLEAVVRNDRGFELASERQDEVIGVGAGRCLLDFSALDHFFESVSIIDLMAQRSVGEDDGL